MTNEKFNILLSELSIANLKYKHLLEKAENEFYNRYGAFPSDIDYDSWIDDFHVGIGCMTAEEIDREINECKIMKKKLLKLEYN
jgi:hypothetical protein